MTNKEIAQGWERANRLVQTILEAHYLGINKEQARNNQKSLAIWIGLIKENGYIYNGAYDEYLTMKI
jgi:hypothetical protein